jgi:DNA-binding CsgD family transcriptional regulator
MLARGEKRETIALALGISVRTVDFHLGNARRRAGVTSTVSLVFFLAVNLSVTTAEGSGS